MATIPRSSTREWDIPAPTGTLFVDHHVQYSEKHTGKSLG
jgi:hypothetical protein